MIYGSLCSGIEAATQAWHPLGWSPAFFSEIEAFPSAVLAHHYPHVPNYGDMTKFEGWPDHAIDLLVGGTPCQSFSVAGLRQGLSDPRGNLMLTYGAVARRYRPRWLVWENAPGVLSSHKGRDLGTFLGMLAELGYGFAYRVLDAQYVRTRRFGGAVPQRRRRVFVVGYLGDWRRAAAVLFDRESLSGNPPPRREAGQNAPRHPERGAGERGAASQRENAGPGMDGDQAFAIGADQPRKTSTAEPGLGSETTAQAEVAPTISARPTGGGGLGTDFDCDGGLIAQDVAHVLETTCHDYSREDGFNMVAHALRGDAMEGVSPTLRAGGHAGSHANAGVMPAVAFDLRGREGGAMPEGPHDTANLRAASGGSSRSYIAQPWAVRRLTPTECERLQGFPDDFTNIPYRGKPDYKYPDGPRYKALGNSMAVNCMEWIGERIAMVEGMG